MDPADNFVDNSTSPAAAPLVFSTYIELTIYGVVVAVGGPLNVYAFYNTVRTYVHSTTLASRLLVLKISLNIADLLTIFVYSLTQFIWLLTYWWYGGDLLCRILKFFYTFTFYLTSNMVASIALDRAYITWHLRVLSSQSWFKLRKLIIISWSLAALCSVPQLLIHSTVRAPSDETFSQQCTPLWTLVRWQEQIWHADNLTRTPESADYVALMGTLERLYNYFHMAMAFFIPATIVVVCYLIIVTKMMLLEHSNETITINEPSPINDTLVSLECIEMTDTNRASTSDRPRIKSMDSRFRIPKVSWPDRISFSGFSQPHRRSLSAEPSALAHSASAVSLRAVDGGSTKMRSASSVPTNPLLGAPGATEERQTSAFWQLTVSRAKHKTMRKAIAILIAYVVLWTPYNVLALYQALAPDHAISSLAGMHFLNGLIVVNAIVNPLIYGVRL
uniref:G-protein coupled receptors family 1 profile domain-containing protein n=1 Tax=Plectus sambesii TaxID=2011161 RepID=A0A914VI34_9BILA